MGEGIGQHCQQAAWGGSYLPRFDLRLTHAAVAIVAGGMLVAGFIAGSPAGIEAASQSGGYSPTSPSYQAGQYYDKPAASPGSIPVQTAPLVPAPAGATVASLSSQYQTSPQELAWANQVTQGSTVTEGEPVLIPPAGPTVLVRVLPDETLTSFAARFRVATGVVLNYNDISSDGSLTPGSFLLLPKAASPSSLPTADFIPSSQSGMPEVAPSTPMAVNPFPWGQCTYWVASQRYVPWSGNAVQWWGAAQSYGVPEGQVPVVGAIAVFDNGYYGHVALVTSVLSNDSWQQSEMNVYGLGVVDTRTIGPDDGYFVGFIY
jgi:surface antigen